MYKLIAKNKEESLVLNKIDAMGNFDTVIKNANKLIDDFAFPVVEVFCKKKQKTIAVLKLAARKNDEQSEEQDIEDFT